MGSSSDKQNEKRRRSSLRRENSNNSRSGCVLRGEEDPACGTASTKTNGSDTTTQSKRPSVPSVFTIDPSVLALATLDEDSEQAGERKAKLFCLCCCDYVRAVIITDIFYIVFAILSIILAVLGFQWSTVRTEDMDEELEEMKDRGGFVALFSIIQIAGGIFFASIAMIGAAQFLKYLILCTGIWFCLDLVVSCSIMATSGTTVGFGWPRALVKAFFAYPHFGLFWALHKGLITQENYTVTEKNCCGTGVAESA